MVDKNLKLVVAVSSLFLQTSDAAAVERPPLTDEQSATAAANYQQYCRLCHGEARQGHANDQAPSLRSKSLMSSGTRELFYATAYGRFGTPMAGYLDEVGGPMSAEEIGILTYWLQSQVPLEPFEFTYDPVAGDVELGESIYARECASCHGANGEGGVGTALGNPTMLSLTTDKFLRYAIVHGREDTAMPPFGETLTSDEIDGVTAFLRSRAAGWAVEKPVLRTPPAAGDYVLNPGAPPAEFQLKDGLYVTSADLLKALQAKRRIVLLDTRVMSQWQMAHIEGSVPVPYHYDYADMDKLAADLPADGTMIVTYCACPRAEAEYVNQKLRELGFADTAVLWEGIRGWVSLGYPVSRGETTLVDTKAMH